MARRQRVADMDEDDRRSTYSSNKDMPLYDMQSGPSETNSNRSLLASHARGAAHAHEMGADAGARRYQHSVRFDEQSITATSWRKKCVQPRR